MTEDFTIKLNRLKIAESGAIGGLKGTVIGALIRYDNGLEMEPKDWERLRTALNAAEAAHKDFVDHLCQPVELLA